MKDTVKIVITHFFIISTGVLFIISLSNLLFDGNEPLSPELPWQIFLTGILGALPSFLFYIGHDLHILTVTEKKKELLLWRDVMLRCAGPYSLC